MIKSILFKNIRHLSLGIYRPCLFYRSCMFTISNRYMHFWTHCVLVCYDISYQQTELLNTDVVMNVKL